MAAIKEVGFSPWDMVAISAYANPSQNLQILRRSLHQAGKHPMPGRDLRQRQHAGRGDQQPPRPLFELTQRGIVQPRQRLRCALQQGRQF